MSVYQNKYIMLVNFFLLSEISRYLCTHVMGKFDIMVYGSTPYVGMAPKKMVDTLKMHKCTLEMSALD